jgi:ABC-2 type transport system ATP-binding protein
MIQTYELGFRSRRRVVLESVSLRVAPEAPTALLGANGSGKSFLLRVLATEFRPTFGCATVGGFDLVRQARQVARSVGFVGEPTPMPSHATVREYLAVFAATHRIPRPQRNQAIADALNLFDLEPLGDRPAASLSRGETQRLELARALLHDPPVLLLDEPLAGLDPPGQVETLEVLRELRDMGKAMLVATNLPELYGDLFAHGVVVDRGRVVAAGSLNELLAPFAPVEPPTWRNALLRWLATRTDNETVPKTRPRPEENDER